MSSRFPIPTRLAALLALAFYAGSPAHAQTAADAAAAARQADVLQRQNQERIQRDIESALPANREPGGIDTKGLVPKVDASAAGVKCRDIDRIAINGAPNLSPFLRERIDNQFLGHCLGVAEIEKILGEITKDYIERGYITTRAYLPAQDMSGGKLEILVVEGVIEKIMLDDGGAGSIYFGNVFPAEGKLLNLRDFEQGVEQINKLSSNNARMDIQPGAAPGASQVVIHNTPAFPLHASLSADNQGSDSTGRNEIGMSLSADRLLKLNELMLYTHRQSQPNDWDRRASKSDSFSFIVPVGYTTGSFSASRSEYVSSITAPSGALLQFRGESSSDTWRLERVMYRNQSTRASLAGSLTLKDTKNFLADQFLEVSSRKLTVFDLDSSVSTGLLGGVLQLDLGYASGLRIGSALQDPSDLPELAPRAQFGKLKYGFSYSRPFRVAGIDASVSTQLTGQHAEDTLYGSEQILIGGIYSVRGFVKNTLSGDNGWYSRNEVSVRPAFALAGQPLPLRLYAGIDFGHVGNRVPNVPSGSLSGFALGVSGSFKGVSFDLFNARPLSQPDFFQQREGSQTWLRLTFSI
jgi:hemolysin activation/secretion protein